MSRITKMKIMLFTLFGVALLQLATALPPKKRETQSNTAIVEVQIFVNPSGVPYSTITVTGASAATEIPLSSTEPDHSPMPIGSDSIDPNEQTSGTPTDDEEDQSPSGFGPGFGIGIAYSPYRSDGTCKAAEEVAQDIVALGDYNVLRLYGTDCSQVSNVLAALEGTRTQIFAGIFDINDLDGEVSTLVQQVNGNWARINTVSVGNELINAGKASVVQVTAAISKVRNSLRSIGYEGPVVTVDTAVAMRSNMALCQASDYCAINCHAFFDGNVLPENSGEFVKGFARQIKDLSEGKEVVVTESGWPNSGTANNQAIPSPENQRLSVNSLRQAFDKDLILYSSFDNKWMSNNIKTFGAEQHWGILGFAPSSQGFKIRV